MKHMYRIFDDIDDLPRTLFHGVHRSRKLPLDEWIEAEVKYGQDGSGQKKKRYKTGFHMVDSEAAALKFLDTMFKYKNQRVVCRVLVDETAGTWPKPHSRHGITLVKRMKITSTAWAKRARLPRRKTSDKNTENQRRSVYRGRHAEDVRVNR